MRHPYFTMIVPLLVASHALADAHAAAEASPGPTADQAYRQLIDGHARFATDTRTLPRQTELRRCETTNGGQHPVAAILTCADSRVPPEMLFDQGIGDLFVIRVAGNVAATDELGTLEYGVEHLHIPLIVVVGHSRCGAVTAVVDGAHAEGNLAQLLKPIVPAAERAKHDHADLHGPALVGVAIQENVRQAMSDLTGRSPGIAKAVEAGRVKIVGGVYDIHAGRIDWLGDSSLAAAPTQATPSHDAHAADAHAADAHAAHAEPAAAAADHSAHPAAPREPAEAHPADGHADAHAPAAKVIDAHAPVIAVAAHANPAAVSKTSPAAARAALPATIADNWHVLTGAVVASTLVGAGVTHFAARGKTARPAAETLHEHVTA